MGGEPNTVIIDYGMGNLRSVEKAIAAVGGRPVISKDPDVIRRSERLILPGVGAFGDAMENLEQSGIDQAIREAVAAGTPLLGLCLGLQLLFSESEEFGQHRGLDLIPGKVKLFRTPGLRVPHVGWNQIESARSDLLLKRDTGWELFLLCPLLLCSSRPRGERPLPDGLWRSLLLDCVPGPDLGSAISS